MTKAEADNLVELQVLIENYRAGTCVGEPASKAQQDIRFRRIAELTALSRPGAEL